jgi:hypothetical protein
MSRDIKLLLMPSVATGRESGWRCLLAVLVSRGLFDVKQALPPWWGLIYYNTCFKLYTLSKLRF